MVAILTPSTWVCNCSNNSSNGPKVTLTGQVFEPDRGFVRLIRRDVAERTLEGMSCGLNLRQIILRNCGFDLRHELRQFLWAHLKNIAHQLDVASNTFQERLTIKGAIGLVSVLVRSLYLLQF